MEVFTIFDIKKGYGKRIKKIRAELSLSLEDFGLLFTPPVNKSVVSNWENERFYPRTKAFETIANLGNVSTQYLMYGITPLDNDLNFLKEQLKKSTLNKKNKQISQRIISLSLKLSSSPLRLDDCSDEEAEQLLKLQERIIAEEDAIFNATLFFFDSNNREDKEIEDNKKILMDSKQKVSELLEQYIDLYFNTYYRK